MTKRLPRFDCHVLAFRDIEARKAADIVSANDRAANLPFFFVLKSSDICTTIWDSAHDAARPVGNITRPRLFGEARAKLWIVAAIDGVVVSSSRFRPSPMTTTRLLAAYYTGKEEAAAAANESACRCDNCGAGLDSFFDIPATCANCEEAKEGFDGMATTRDWTRPAIDPAPRDIFGPREKTPADLKAAARAFALAFALAPVLAALESPLAPRPAALARLAAFHAGAF